MKFHGICGIFLWKMLKRPEFKVFLVAILLFSPLVGYAAQLYLKYFDFNEENPLSEWGRMVLNGQVDYEVMKRGGDGYVQALSEKACSALYYRIGYKLKDYPIMSWQWQVAKFPDKSAAGTGKEKDDYAARVYVIFPFLSFSSSKFIEYVWDNDGPAGTIMKSPEGDNIMLIVARSGKAKGQEWVNERRNVYEDYVLAFGKPPERRVGAIAIMCDADSTKSDAESMFDDITILNEKGTEWRVDKK